MIDEKDSVPEIDTSWFRKDSDSSVPAASSEASPSPAELAKRQAVNEALGLSEFSPEWQDGLLAILRGAVAKIRAQQTRVSGDTVEVRQDPESLAFYRDGIDQAFNSEILNPAMKGHFPQR